MLPLDVDYLARREQLQNLIREAEHERLSQEAKLGQYEYRETQGRTFGWFRDQMMKWGARLHLL